MYRTLANRCVLIRTTHLVVTTYAKLRPFNPSPNEPFTNATKASRHNFLNSHGTNN